MPEIHEIKHPEWIRVHGTVEPRGDQYLIRASVGGGAFTMHKDDVWVKDGIACVRNNANAKIVEKPTIRLSLGVDPAEILDDCHSQDDCPLVF
jgi:hypothetical protein